MFDDFTAKYLALTKRYASNEALSADPPAADAYFAGSDQIWNPLFRNGRDPAFYLDFVRHGLRASYAASFAVGEFPQELRDVTARYLRRFDHISVREASGLAILQSLGIQNAETVIDPVFLLDKAHWESMARLPAEAEKPYLLVYDFDNSPAVRALAEKIARERGLKIYSVFDLPYAQRCFALSGPQEFLGLVHQASFVLSNSFHATAFSVIFEREFAVVERAEKINTRMRDFTALLGIPERMLSADNPVPSDIDWNSVHCRLDTEIAGSKAYIDRVLGSVKE